MESGASKSRASMPAINSSEGAAQDGTETGNATHHTGSDRPSSSLRALSSYRLKRLSLKKRPQNGHVPILLRDLCTADAHLSEDTVAKKASEDSEKLSQGPPVSTTTTEGPFNDQQSSLKVTGHCLGSKNGKPYGWIAADQSGPCLMQVAGMSGDMYGLPMPSAGPSGVSMFGRQPLQTWVPRKRNLASFDALDELSSLTRHEQHLAGAQGLCLPAVSQSEPNQQQSAGLPFRAPKRGPGAQEPALQKADPPGSPILPPAGLPEDLQVATGPHARHAQESIGRPCAIAQGTDLAATSQLPWRAGKGAPRRRLHHKPFAPPRPVQRPEAEHGNSDRPLATSLVSLACGDDPGQCADSSSAAIPHEPHPHASQRRTSQPVSRQSAAAMASAGVISDSEASEASEVAPAEQPSGVGLADVPSLNEPCRKSPPRVSPHSAQHNRTPQQRAVLDAVDEGHACSHHAQPLSSANDLSHCSAETASPATAAPAGVATQRGRKEMSARRKKLKRLYSSGDGLRAPNKAGRTHDTEGEDVGVLARLGSFCELGPGCKDDEGKMAPSQGVAPSSCAHLEPVSGPAEEMGAACLDTLSPVEPQPARRLQALGQGLRRLRRMTDVLPEVSVRGSCNPESRSEPHDEAPSPRPAMLGAPWMNPFKSAKPSLPQETRLACHAAPAQPQCGNLGDDLLLEDMHALLRGHVGQQQARAGNGIDAAPEATASGIIDLASDDSSGPYQDCAGPPARPPQRRICLPTMPSSPGRRPPQGRQPSNRLYLGAYSSADIMPEPSQPGRPQVLLQEMALARGKPSPDSVREVWQESRQSEEDPSRRKGTQGAVSQTSHGVCLPADRQGNSLLGNQQIRQSDVLGALQSRTHSAPGTSAPAETAHPGGYGKAAGASRQLGHLAPWWHCLDDFVPVAAIRDGRDPRDGSRVLIDYKAQFSGNKQPTAAGGGFQQAKRGRKAQRDASAARIAEATHAEGSGVGHWLTTHQHGRRRKVYVTAGGRTQLTGAAAHTAYERDKRVAGSFARDT